MEKDSVLNQLMDGASTICRLGFCEKAKIIFPCLGIGITFHDNGSWRGLAVTYEFSMKKQNENVG